MFGRNRKQISALQREDSPHQQPKDRISRRSRHARTWAAGAVLVSVRLAVSETPADSQPITPTAPADACNGYSVCPVINFQDVINSDPDVGRLNAFITAIESQTLEKILDGEYSADGAKSILGEVMIYDRNLSVNGLVACATCHTPQQGFTGGSSLTNQTTVAMVGAVGDRASGRKPMSHAYAPFAPVLVYRASTGDFVGGNFWDACHRFRHGESSCRSGVGTAAEPGGDGKPGCSLRGLSSVAIAVSPAVRTSLRAAKLRDHLACRHR
jgi:hypothetical protein